MSLRSSALSTAIGTLTVQGYRFQEEAHDCSPDRVSHKRLAVAVCGGLMQDLNTLIPIESGWELAAATGINNSGQIVGRGMISGQTHAFLLTPRSPSQLIDDLTGLIQSFNLPKGIENSLIVKLQNAQNALAGGDADTAHHLLNTFSKEVNARTGKTLTTDQANQLLDAANAIITALGG